MNGISFPSPAIKGADNKLRYEDPHCTCLELAEIILLHVTYIYTSAGLEINSKSNMNFKKGGNCFTPASKKDH